MFNMGHFRVKQHLTCGAIIVWIFFTIHQFVLDLEIITRYVELDVM